MQFVCVFVAINRAHIRKSNSPESSCLVEEAFRSISLIDKKTRFVVFVFVLPRTSVVGCAFDFCLFRCTASARTKNWSKKILLVIPS